MPQYLKGDQLGEGLQSKQWVVIRKIGEGQFAEVYEVYDAFHDRDARYAMKVEKSRDTPVRQEVKVLKRLQACSQVLQLVNSGMHGDKFYIISELLGPNMAEHRRSFPGGQWPLPEIQALGFQLLDALQQLHSHGFIHRDVKPANFCASRQQQGTWSLIDFGLARKFTDDSGKVLPPRSDAGFRGSTTYASVPALELQDQGRRDDLWSWLYVVAEMVAGGLPWRGERGEGERAPELREQERQAALASKRACLGQPALLTAPRPLPDGLRRASEHLAGLQHGDEPDYSLLRDCLRCLARGQQEPACQLASLDSADTDAPVSQYDANGLHAGSGQLQAALPAGVPDTPLSPDEEQPGWSAGQQAGAAPRPWSHTEPSPAPRTGCSPAATPGSSGAAQADRAAGDGPPAAKRARLADEEPRVEQRPRARPGERSADWAREGDSSGGRTRDSGERDRQRSRQHDRGQDQEPDERERQRERERRADAHSSRQRDRERDPPGDGDRDGEYTREERDRDRERWRVRERERERERDRARERDKDRERDRDRDRDRARERERDWEREREHGRERERTARRPEAKRDSGRGRPDAGEGGSDSAERTERVRQLAAAVRDDPSTQAVRQALRELQGEQLMGLLAYSVQRMATVVDDCDLDQLGQWLDDFTAFMRDSSRQVWSKWEAYIRKCREQG